MRVKFDELDLTEDGLILTYCGKPFTGVAFEEEDSGVLVSETEFLNGQKNGIFREWSSNGRLIKQASFALDSLHGNLCEWDEDGGLRVVAEYEIGIRVRERRLGPHGVVVDEFVLQAGSLQHEVLKKLRESAIGQRIRRLVHHG